MKGMKPPPQPPMALENLKKEKTKISNSSLHTVKNLEVPLWIEEG